MGVMSRIARFSKRRLPEGAFRYKNQIGRFIAATRQGVFVSLIYADETFSSALSDAVSNIVFVNTKTLLAHYG